MWPLMKHRLMYADDVAMFSRSRLHLKRALVELVRNAGEDGLTVNVRKTKWMKCGTGGPGVAGDFMFLGGELIERVKHFNYLGVILTERE